MLFNSFEFAIFFTIVFSLYFFTYKRLRVQNILLLASSYLFYGWWDWRFLSLIIISSICDYFIGLEIEKSNKKVIKKRFLTLSIFINLGILGFFKYYNFFAESTVEVLDFFGFQSNPFFLNIILPVGISFYTFQTMSYTIDIYRKQMKATENLLEFMTFVSFFPQLVAGPIERAKNLLPQFGKKRKFNTYEAIEGIKQSIWGLFKKIVIADNCALYVNQIFENSESLPGSMLLIGVLLFAFQIYGDFSGYSDIAIGISRIMGFNLMQNFRSPYLAENIQDFWRRWHISLSTWFRDYVYIPLGGNRVDSKFRRVVNIVVTFTVSGFWHGANWTFIVWGALHSLFYLIQNSFHNFYGNKLGKPLKMPKILSITITFTAVCFAWIFFRADSLSMAFNIILEILSPSLFTNPIPELKRLGSSTLPFILLISIGYMIAFELFNRNAKYSFQVSSFKFSKRTLAYCSLLFLILFFRATNGKIDFIYFQF